MEIKIDDIVKQVLAEFETPVKAQKPVTTFALEKPSYKGNEVGKKAVLCAPETFEIQSFQIPELSAKEILVQMEGCMISNADTLEFTKEKRVGTSSAVGASGTGTIIKLGSDDIKDAKGNILKVGDKVVGIKKSGLSNSYGVNQSQPSGWFSNYVVLQGGNSVYQTNRLDLESRLLVETIAAVNNTVARTIKLAKLDERSSVAVVGSGLAGLAAMAILKCHGITNIVAVDDEAMKNICMTMGAKEFIGIHSKDGVQGAADVIKASFGSLADAAFNCVPTQCAKSTARRLVKNNGNVYDLAYVLGGGRSSAGFFDEAVPVGGHFFTQKEYENAIALLEDAIAKEIPMYQLITHRFYLEQLEEACWTSIRNEGIGIAVFNR
ncbi:MAG: oxidoreductase [Eubacteriales bacterium]|nr:oxidoreductase [Eubacteriales bacterium]